MSTRVNLDAGALAALAEGRSRLGDGRALPLGAQVVLLGAAPQEGRDWGAALTEAGARARVAALHAPESWSRADLVVVVVVVPGDAWRAFDAPDAPASIVVCDEVPARTLSVMLRAGVLDVLVRPVTPADLVEACRHALLRMPPPPVRHVSHAADLPVEGATGAALARTRLPVLIVGETGTGKSRMARQLHETLTPSAPFIEINAAGLAGNLLTSELFGHERGAFTGAHATKTGLVAVANGGTLFLDEIGELSADAQAQLLSFLDTGKYRAVGGIRETRSDARVLCATNRDLPAMVKENRFREDLYYRLASIVIPLPALGSQRGRIPGLVVELARQCTERLALPPLEFEDAALAVFAEHAWPGNIRQLRFVVERLVALFEGRRVTAEVVVPLLPGLAQPLPTGSPSQDMPSLAEMERTLVERAMLETNGNRTRAAELLGITPRGLYNKLRRIGTAFRSTE